jgi:integrase
MSPDEPGHRFQSITFAQTNGINGGEDGENSPLDGKHEPEIEPRLGTDGTGNTKTLEGEETTLRVSEVIERFRQQTRTRLRDETTEQYVYAFRRFARSVNLESYTRRQLSGPRGRALIMTHLDELPKPSWTWAVAAMKPVWTYGMNLPWPIDSKKDLPRLPRIRPRKTPPDSQVKEWAKAVANEKDPYLRLVWLLIAQHGWRPSHVCRLKWRNVQYNDEGKPVAVIADGVQESFKTTSPVVARLAPNVTEALQQWKDRIGSVAPEQPIIPWRSVTGRLSGTQGSPALTVHWLRLEKKWQLPHLCPNHMRHWVATTCRRAGLSRQASAYLMGHDATQGGAMRDWYDNPQLQDVLDEQALKLPYGPLGVLNPPTAELEGGLSKEVVALVSAYLVGQLGTMELATQMEKTRLQRVANQTPNLEP